MTESFNKEVAWGNMDDWATALRNVNPELADRLGSKKLAGIEGLEEMDLPRYNHKTIPLEDFLKNPESFMDDLDCEKFYIILLPKRDNLRKCGEAGLSKDEVMELIRNNVSSEECGNYDIVLNQYFENEYGGSVIVGQDESMVVEFRRGQQGPVAWGTETPEFTVKRDKFTGIFKYSFEDESLRKEIYDLVLTIPHSGEGFEMKFVPGYYEFVLVKRSEDSEIEPIFLDYQNDPAYFFSKNKDDN